MTLRILFGQAFISCCELLNTDGRINAASAAAPVSLPKQQAQHFARL
jgi:hypothetical protein